MLSVEGLVGSADWILSGFLVLLFARSRFSTPARFTASTTVWRFRVAAWSYYAAVLMTFTLLAFVIADTPGIVNAVGSGAALPSALDEVSAPVLAALLLTTLMPHFPLLTRVDEWLLTFFREMGNIPAEVRALRHRLKKSEPQISDEARLELLKLVETDVRLLAIDARDLRFDADGSPQHAYTKVLALLSRIEHLGTDRDFCRVVEMFGDEYRRIQSRFEELTVQAVRCFALSEGEPPEALPSAAAISPVLECRRNFKEKCDELYGLMCELVAYAVLRCGRSRADRNAKLAGLGFSVLDEDDRGIDADQIVAVAFAIFVIMVGGISLFGGRAGEPHRVLLLSVMIAVIYGVAIFCAVLPKVGTPAAMASAGRPVRVYLLSGLAAATAGLIISVAFKTLMWQDFTKAAGDMRWAWPWSLMSFMFAVTIAALCDNAPGGKDSNGNGDTKKDEERWLRWAEGTVAAVVLAVTAAFIWRLLDGLAQMPEWPTERSVPELPMVAGVSAAIGFVAGAFVPVNYRRMRRRSAERTATVAPAPAAPQPAPA